MYLVHLWILISLPWAGVKNTDRVFLWPELPPTSHSSTKNVFWAEVPSRYSCSLTSTEQPIVHVGFIIGSPWQRVWINDVLPTPESPITIIRTLSISIEAIKEFFILSYIFTGGSKKLQKDLEQDLKTTSDCWRQLLFVNRFRHLVIIICNLNSLKIAINLKRNRNLKSNCVCII